MEVADASHATALPGASGTSSALVTAGAAASHAPSPGASGEAENIAVCIRVRPLNDREVRNKDVNVLRTVSTMNLISITDGDGQPLPGKHNVFQYDHIFDERASTRAMYKSVAQRIVKSSLDGINGTIFAYGQTSSGKTYTMTGTGGLPFQADDGGGSPTAAQQPSESMGILQLAVEDIFGYIEQSTDRDFLLRVSFVEIYNEVVKDLLNPSEKGHNLKLREDPRKGVYVESREEIITNYEDILQLLHVGNQRRTVGHTAMNDKSSRSHSIFRIVIESKQKSASPSRRQSEDDVHGAVLVACLSLVDLAGSESMRHTAAEGARQREAGNINKSLLTLSRVINSLASAGGSGAQNAPFRDSKLTRLLQNSLDGNTRTLIICCVTPADRYIDETKSTLQFAARAKTIQTSAHVNEVLDDQAQLKRLKREVHELKKLVNSDAAYNALKAENELLHNEQNKNKAEIARLLGLMLSSSSACVRGIASARKLKPRAKRMRETWCPGDFSANNLVVQLDAKLGAAAFASPNPKARKRLVPDETKENLDPQNLLAALDAAGRDDENDDGEDTGSSTKRRRGMNDKMDGDATSSAAARSGLAQPEAQVTQLVELLENAIVPKTSKETRFEEEEEDPKTLGLEARVMRLVTECESLAAAAHQNEQLAGEHEVLKMAAEELQMRLQLSNDQEAEELENTMELLDHVKNQLSKVQDERDSEQLKVDELQKEREAWVAERQQMEASMAELMARLEAVSVLGSSGNDEVETAVRDLTLANEALKKELTEFKRTMEEMQRSHEEKLLELDVTAKREIEELSSQLQDAFVEQEELKLEKDEEIAKLEEELLAKSDELEQKASEFADREAALLDEMAALKAKHVAIVSEAPATEQNEELAAENERLQSERSNLMDAMVELEEQLQQTAKMHAGLEAQVSCLKGEKTELSSTLAAFEEKLAALQLERDDALAQLEEARSSFDDQAATRVRKLEQELAQAQAELNEASNDQEAEANRADEAMQELERTKLTMEELHQTHVEEMESVQTEAAERVRVLEADRESMVQQMKTILAEKDLKIKQSEAAEIEARSYRDFLQAEMDEVSQKVASLESAKSHFANENAHLRQQLTELNNEMLQVPDTLAGEIEELTDRIESLRAELDSKIAHEKILTTEIKKLMLRSEDQEAELTEKTTELARLRETIQALDEEKSVWFQKSASSDEMQAELVRMREERWGLAVKWEESESALARERRESARLATQLQDLEAEHDTLEREKQTLAKTLVETESRAKQIASELDATQTEKLALEDMVTELESKFDVLEIAKKALDDSLTVRVAELATKSSENAELRTQLDQAAAELQVVCGQLEESQQQKADTAAVDALQEQVTTLEQKCHELETSKQTLLDEAASVALAKADLVEELSALEAQLAALSEAKMDLQTKLDSAVAALDDSSSSVADANEKLASLARELESSQNDVARATASKQVMEDEATQLQKSIDELRSTLAEKEKQLESRVSTSSDDLTVELQELTVRLETEAKRRQKAELDAKSYEETLDLLREDLKHKLDALKSLQIASQEAAATKQALEAELEKLRADFTRAKEEQAELRYQNQQRLMSTQGAESVLKETVEMLELELADAKASLVKTEGEWKARAQQAEQQFRRLEGELQAAQSKELALTEKIERLEQQLASTKDALVETETEWKARAQQAEQHFRRLEGELRSSNDERARLAEVAERASATQSDVQSEIEQLKSVQQSLATEKQQLEEKLETRERHWAIRIDEIINKSSFENASLRVECQDAQKELEAFQAYANGEISKLRASIEQNDMEMMEMSGLAKQREDALFQQVKDLETRLVETQCTVDSLRAQLGERDESSGAMAAELSHKVEQLTQQLGEVDAERSHQAEQFSTLKGAMEKLESEDYQHRNELEELTESLKSSQMEAMHYHSQLSEVQVAKDKMEALIETQKKRIEKLEKVKMTTETLELFRKLKSDRESLQLQVRKLESQLKDLAASKALTREAADHQQSRLLRLKEEEVTMFKAHVEELKSHIEELKRGVQNEKDRNALMRSELQSVVEDIRDKAQQEVDDMRTVLKEKSEQVVELEDQIEAMRKDKDAMVDHKSSKESYLEKENLELLVENRQLKKRLDGRGGGSAGSASYRASLLDDDVAAFEASAKAASALLAEPSAASKYPQTPDLAAAQQVEETKTAVASSGGLSSFLKSSSSGSSQDKAEEHEEEEEEARPACSQQ